MNAHEWGEGEHREHKLLRELLLASANEVDLVLQRELGSPDIQRVGGNDGYALWLGDTGLCLVAHKDIVGGSAPDWLCIEGTKVMGRSKKEPKSNKFWKPRSYWDDKSKAWIAPDEPPKPEDVSGYPCILGADDRAGVAGVVTLYKALKAMGCAPSVLVLDGEESGGKGVHRFTKDYPDIDAYGVRCFIELDRRGRGQAVNYDRSQQDAIMEKLIKLSGHKSSWGTYSDVSTLTDETRIPHWNLSIGFMSEHTTRESIDLKDYEENLRMAMLLCLHANDVLPDIAKLPERKKWSYDYEDDWYSNWLKSERRSFAYNKEYELYKADKADKANKDNKADKAKGVKHTLDNVPSPIGEDVWGKDYLNWYNDNLWWIQEDWLLSDMSPEDYLEDMWDTYVEQNDDMVFVGLDDDGNEVVI